MRTTAAMMFYAASVFYLLLAGGVRAALGFLPLLPTFHTHHCSLTWSPLAVRTSSHEDDERLLLTEPAMAAYVQAEVHAWLLEKRTNQQNNNIDEETEQVAQIISMAVHDSYESASRIGILSHHGALITFLTTELADQNTHPLVSSELLERVFQTNAHQVAKRCVDVLHHRLYRGTYTKTLSPTGAGEVAARKAVGLPAAATAEDAEESGDDDNGNCLVEAPPELTTDCLWTEGDDAEWRKKRFERITMEGWRDPRRGNSGTTR